MASDSSFDVVSEFDHQEMVNAVDQTAREVGTRFDLKDTKSEIVLEKDKISLNTPSEMQLTAIKDILESKMVRRNLSLKILDFGKVEDAAGGRVRQVIKLQQGLDQDRAKEITKLIRDRFPKVKTAIQGDAVRVTGKSRDELQGVIGALKERDFPIPLQFTNYR